MNCMKLTEYENGVFVEGLDHFNPTHIFECGQCFRWNRETNASYTGVAMGRVINVSIHGDGFYFDHTNKDEFLEIWAPYFDLDRDYGKIIKEINKDPIIHSAIQFGSGIRLLSQEPFETVISFILSQRCSIPKIKKVVELLCASFGKKIMYNGKAYYTFPKPETLARLSKEDLAVLRCGYRDEYILEAARMVAGGTLDLTALYAMSYQDAKDALLKIKGIGNKIALCILLFAYKKYSAFPVDTWTKKVMERYQVSEKDIETFCFNYFGSKAGFAQQYLFYCERENGFVS